MVTLNPGGFSTATDANGAYSRQVPPGTYTATASASQSFYSPASATVVVTNGGTTTQNFFLTGVANLIYQSSSPSALDTAFCSNLSVTLLNNGPATATGISATLSSAVPGVVIEQATSTYPNIAPWIDRRQQHTVQSALLLCIRLRGECELHALGHHVDRECLRAVHARHDRRDPDDAIRQQQPASDS